MENRYNNEEKFLKMDTRINKELIFEETIKNISKGFNEWLYSNEATVKQGIILYVLNSLGWNIFNTQEVYPEYTVDGKKADYVLFKDNKPDIVIEAKSLDRSQKNSKIDKDEVQAFQHYAKKLGVGKVIITDGLYWKFYRCYGNYGYPIENINILKDENTNKIKELLYKDSGSWADFKPLEEDDDEKEHILTLYDDFENWSGKIDILLDKNNRFNFSIQHGYGESGWKSMYQEFCQQLYALHEEKMQALINNPYFNGNTNKSFDIKDKGNWLCIKKNTLYANPYKGANLCTKMMRDLMRYFGILAENVKIINIDKQVETSTIIQSENIIEKSDNNTSVITPNSSTIEYKIKNIEKIRKTILYYDLLSLGAKNLESLCKYKGGKIYIKDEDNIYSEHQVIAHNNCDVLQIGGGITDWYNARISKIQANSQIEVSFNESELYKGYHVVYIKFLK